MCDGLITRWHSGDGPIYTSLTHHGWQLVEEKLEPLWYDGDSIPQQLVDNLSDEDVEEDDLDAEFDGDVDEVNYGSESEDEL